MSKQCKIVEDLLPLYHDGICSEESRELVDEHLAQCEHCRVLLEQIDGELVSPPGKGDDIAPLVGINRAVKKGRKKALIAGISIALAAVLVLLTGVSIWWYNREFTYYRAFAEDHTVHSANGHQEDYNVLQSILVGARAFACFDSTYRYDVIVPSFLSRDGNVDMTRLGDTADRLVSVGISRWNDVEYAFHVHINDGEYHYFIVDSDLKQYYLDHWTQDVIEQQDAALAEYEDEIRTLIRDATEMWPFLK